MLSCRAFPTPVTAVRTLADFTTTTIIINGELLTGCLKLTTQVVSFWRLSAAALCAFGPFYWVTVTYTSDVANVAGFALDWRIDLIAGTLWLLSHVVRGSDKWWYNSNFMDCCKLSKLLTFITVAGSHGSQTVICERNTYAIYMAKMWPQLKLL